MLIVTRHFIETCKEHLGIFCLSSAASYHNLGTNTPKVIQLLTDKTEENDRHQLIRRYYTPDMTNNLITLPTGNFVTNLDRTILEEMNYNPIDEFISQEMEDYGIENKLEYLRAFNDKWNYCTKENFDLALECYYEWIADPH